MTNQAVLPDSIARQLAEAEALEKQLYATPAPTEGNTDPAPVEPDPEPTPAEIVEPVVPQPEQRSQEETFEQRYRILQGKYDAEVPRLHAQLREAMSQLQYMAGELDTLKAAKQTEQAPANVPDNDAETFGEDLVTTIDRRAAKLAAEMVSKELQPMRDYVRQLEARLGDVNQQVAVSAEDRFYNALAKAVPDYEAINVDQGFLRWLGEVVPGTGRSRQEFLNEASNALDSVRVAEIFSDYKLLTGKQVQGQQQRQVRQELERQTAPQSTRSSSATPPVGRVYTRADYERAYDPRTVRELGADKAAALQAEMDQAVAENRVQW